MKTIKKHIRKYSNDKAVLFSIAFVLAVPIALFALPDVTKTQYTARDIVTESQETDNEAPSTTTKPPVAHMKTPEAVRAIYMTSCVVGTPSFREDLVSLVEETELNSIVIDIKDYSGTISFQPQNPLFAGAWERAECGARDMQAFLEELHAKGIYVIGRITVFQDPYYSSVHPELAVRRASDGAVWHDYKGLSFIDVGAREYWDYIVLLSKEAYDIGFDELNFDYVRFPSDGNMKDIAFMHTTGSKAEQLEHFFAYLQEKLTDVTVFQGARPVLSADLFGMTTTNTDDLNIGQVLERALSHFDYIAPMVYPSHYPKGFNGWANPNNYPYDVVYFSMKSAVERAIASTTPVLTLGGSLLSTSTSTPALYTKPYYHPHVLRPWLQDFDYGGDYDIPEVKAQIQAAYDVGLNSWMLWAPSNHYTRGALESL
ncbi:MAG TPA: putative glycoside hydrolase [Candidatus Paceibacterota bacterium]